MKKAPETDLDAEEGQDANSQNEAAADNDVNRPLWAMLLEIGADGEPGLDVAHLIQPKVWQIRSQCSTS